nr:unnamed protein product [Digitaria exilis]
MAARSWLPLLVVVAAAVLGVHGQGAAPDSTGFISIDCGIPEQSSYVDGATKLPYVSDAGFTDAGANHNISAEYIKPSFSKRYLNVRSFPDAPRRCYTLGSLTPGSKYLLRAVFMYGNYDGLGRPPAFDLHLGVNFWTTVTITAPTDVCLVDIGAGTPFISGLDLRPLDSALYPQVNATQGLVLLARRNMGPTDATMVVRYPDDPYDRAWTPWINPEEWSEISTAEQVGGLPTAPSAVMQTAVTPLNGTKMSIAFSWVAVPNHVYPVPRYICFFHYAELQSLDAKKNETRQFYITINGKPFYHLPITPHYLFTDAVYDTKPNWWGFDQYNVTLNATANSTLPPVINAVEVFSVISTANVGTYAQDESSVKPQNGVTDARPRSQNGNGHRLPQLENRRFTYKELETITNNFQRVLGRGGFGSVYDGLLEDGTQVAVKLRSESSNQGVREFLTETEAPHCTGVRTSPAFVHRDVKTSNILLNANLEAKIADFGLLKAFRREGDTHVSTDRVVGTHGYLAPEYASALQLTEKSDVYSLGVVLLEVITGQPPILRCPEPTNVVQWVRQRLARGEDIGDVVDARLRGGYDANAAWKATDVALKCTEQVPTQRPTMTDVVAQLHECLELEEGR